MLSDFGLRSLGRRESEPRRSEIGNSVTPESIINFIAPKFVELKVFGAHQEESQTTSDNPVVVMGRLIETESKGWFGKSKKLKEEELKVRKSDLIAAHEFVNGRLSELSYCGELLNNQRLAAEYRRLSGVQSILAAILPHK